ncbi:MAG: fumarate hydratase [Deltaproteobacteria bacterium]|nr:fumarate hydratase [Deltaproteobacteria bacterium]
MTKEFAYQDMFGTGGDGTEYRMLTGEYISTGIFEDREIIKVAPEGLTLLAEEAFRDASHLLRSAHLKQIAEILKDPDASANDRYVALELIKNAVISSEGIFPMCQDTGTAIVMGEKGQSVWTGFSDEEAISRGIYNAYVKNNLRYSQMAPLSMYDEKNTGCNLPAQIDIRATQGDSYDFLFIAKGGGSANKTFLFQETKALLNKESLTGFMTERIKGLGAAACPPYHLVFVVGGTSAEANLRTVKLASTGYLDHLPDTGNEQGRAFRDKGLEKELLRISMETGPGAQFGGRYFCLDVRVVRLPRHGASCPVGMGVSCNAHRNIRGRITREGIFLERLETDPARFLAVPEDNDQEAVRIDLEQPMERILGVLTKYPVSTRLLLTGKMIVARDIAHARIKERMDRGEGLPQYFKDHIIYYAGPAKTPEGYASGSFGPTTAGRMDPYVPVFQAKGASMITLAKGNRSKAVTDSCKRFGGFYLGSIGGAAARLGRDCITKVEVVEYPELGMEAVHLITVKDFPAFILTDDKGNDFYEMINSI